MAIRNANRGVQKGWWCKQTIAVCINIKKKNQKYKNKSRDEMIAANKDAEKF